MSVTLPQPPIFVIGPERSGTTLVEEMIFGLAVGLGGIWLGSDMLEAVHPTGLPK